ncbi:MAG: peroxiredoxin [Myxococcales bacterium]|nr:peroxiredoxin [Myxococcales bacterium]
MAIVQQKAPSFRSKAVVDGNIVDVSLADYLGRWVVLFFYPLDFTFLCPTELKAYEAIHDQFEALETTVIGCSIDSVYTHQAWQKAPAEEGGLGALSFIHMSDVGGRIAKQYGVLGESGEALRAIFLIDKEGIVRHESVNDMAVGRNSAETLRILQAFQHSEISGELCPANWSAGAGGISVPRSGDTAPHATRATGEFESA